MNTAKKCPMCAEQIPTDAVFCPYCGTRFGEEAQTAPTPAAPVAPVIVQSASPALPPARKSRAGIWIAGVLALVIILGGIGTLLWTQRTNVPVLSSLFATATPSATLTLQPTVTLTPRPTFTPSHTPTITPTIPPPYDGFSGTVLDLKKWEIVLGSQDHLNDRVTQDGRVIVSLYETARDDGTMLKSTWGFTGDFDIQIDFQMGEGWRPPSSSHLDGAYLGVIIDNNQYHITLIYSSPTEGLGYIFMAWTDKGLTNFQKPISAATTSGKYRLIRIGTSLEFLYNIGKGWKSVGTMTVPSSLAKVYFGNGTPYTSHTFKTYFDNFVILSGTPTYP